MGYSDEEQQKAYQKAYYAANKELYAERTKTAREKRREYVNGIKTNNPCVDCGQKYHYCQMQFDHIGDDKIADINKLMKTRSIETVKAEIAKCELVCANCHAIRTWKRIQASLV